LLEGTPTGAYHGVFHPVELLAKTLQALMDKTGVEKKEVEDVIAGCVSPIGSQGGNIARLALLAAGFPEHVSGVQLNRMCGSGQQAVHFAAQAIASGDMDLTIGCGIEMMSTERMGSDFKPSAQLQSLLPFNMYHQGYSAELLASKYGITREEMDAFAGESHRRAHEATKAGLFKGELFPIRVPKKDKDGKALTDTYELTGDEGVRYPVDTDKLKSLKTPFKEDGVITPAHASQVSDGAGAILLASWDKVVELKLKPIARIVARAVVGSNPEIMLSGPIEATREVLKKAKMKMEQIDRVEINEAFASVVLAWKKELKPDMNKVNVNGGAIAHGHPLGASGAILMTKLVYELKRTGLRYGLQTMCIGWGMATATIIENLDNKQAQHKSSKL